MPVGIYMLNNHNVKNFEKKITWFGPGWVGLLSTNSFLVVPLHWTVSLSSNRSSSSIFIRVWSLSLPFGALTATGCWCCRCRIYRTGVTVIQSYWSIFRLVWFIGSFLVVWQKQKCLDRTLLHPTMAKRKKNNLLKWVILQGWWVSMWKSDLVGVTRSMRVTWQPCLHGLCEAPHSKAPLVKHPCICRKKTEMCVCMWQAISPQ